MRLKDCTEIKIDNKDVERIKMFNEVVWEKMQATTITLTVSPNVPNPTSEGGGYIITKNQTFTLTATVTSRKGTVTDGTVIFSGNNQTYSRTITNGKAELSLPAPTVGLYTYTATFQQTKKYKSSSSDIKIKIGKDTPKLTIVGEATVYNGWVVGARLTDSSGTIPLKNTDSWFKVNGVEYCRTTNDNGYVVLNINRLPVNNTYEIKFWFEGNDEYETLPKIPEGTVNRRQYLIDNALTRDYTVLDNKTKTLSITNAELGQKDANMHYQRWERNGTTFSCYKNNQQCWTQTNTIGCSGTYRIPHPLKIHFEGISLNNVTKITLKYDSNQYGGCVGSSGGALFASAPDIGISYNGVDFPHTNNNAINFPQINYYGNYYASIGPISQEVYREFDVKGYQILTNQISVIIYYPENIGYEEGFLTLYNVRLIVSYIPEQPTKFV